MTILLSLLCAILAGALIRQHTRWAAKERDAVANLAAAQTEVASLTRARDEALKLNRALHAEVESLAPFREVRNASQKAEEIRIQASEIFANAMADAKDVQSKAQAEAEQIIAKAKGEASNIRNAAEVTIQARKLEAQTLATNAARDAEDIVKAARERAEQIAGDAYKAMNEAESLKQVAKAMQNVVDGYGDKYLKPTISLIDDLAEEYGFDEAGQQLKSARNRSKSMIDGHQAAACDYVEVSRRDTAIRFVIDAFNGRVDSVLSRTKSDNVGTLEQQIRDAYALVNHNGAAFRNARITEQFLQARLNELKYACMAHALRERDKEQQRRIREQIREEEKARREIERALKEAAKEEDALQKAMAKVQAQVAKANDEQRAAFEAQLRELEAKLSEAESRNQRALSMAQQTKAGHVYVISNIGSFGEHVYKVGMTRRLEPLDRVKELGDASVPFAFDVHAMIWSDDAPRLESQLHKIFVRAQVNKVNPRKEFFRVPLGEIRGYLEQQGISASWTVAAAAAEFRETLELERQLNENPAVATEWLSHQLAAADEQRAQLVEIEDE
jgi:chromosome segregation ATPase